MSEYKNVLIAVDFDGSEDLVLEKAQTFLGESHRVHVVHAEMEPSYIYPSYAAGGYIADMSITLPEKLRVAALHALHELLEESELDVEESIVEFGRASDIILDTASIMQADLIVMGSHGRHGVRLLLGSTANAVLHRAQCDVLAVRIPQGKFPADDTN